MARRNSGGQPSSESVILLCVCHKDKHDPRVLCEIIGDDEKSTQWTFPVQSVDQFRFPMQGVKAAVHSFVLDVFAQYIQSCDVTCLFTPSSDTDTRLPYAVWLWDAPVLFQQIFEDSSRRMTWVSLNALKNQEESTVSLLSPEAKALLPLLMQFLYPVSMRVCNR